jgi:hypothetical protein
MYVKRWKKKANYIDSSIEEIDNESILTALLGRISNLSFMNFCQIALEKYMKHCS